VSHRSLNTVANELLVLRCRGGDARALAVLYERWQPRFARHASYLTGRRDSVPDICQEAWLAIVRRIGRLDDPARFPAWAYRIVSRRCADWIRERTRAAARTAPLTREPTAASDGTRDEDILRVRRALRRLPGEQRAILALHYGEQLSVREISVALDVPPGTVKSRLHHARRTLSRILERQ